MGVALVQEHRLADASGQLELAMEGLLLRRGRGEIAEIVQPAFAHRHDLSVTRATTSVHPDWPIVLEPNSPWDYEPVDRFHVWARFFGIANPLMLRVEITPGNLTKFEQWLVGQMQHWAAVGEVWNNFQPLPDPTELKKRNGHCFAIGFWHPVVSPCRSLDFSPDRYIPHG